MQSEEVLIKRVEYRRLLEASDFLEVLLQAGVDNWHGYDNACKIRDELEDD